MSTYVQNPQSKPDVNLAGVNNDAIHALSRCKTAAKKAGWTDHQIDNFLDECKVGNHENMREVIAKHFNVVE
jgi:hypothetical protein